MSTVQDRPGFTTTLADRRWADAKPPVRAVNRPLLRPLLEETVHCEEHRGEPVNGALFPEEEAAVRRATDRRRLEYATVRACARACLSRMGQAPAPILRGPGGAPVWPPGVCGSMTHCDGYAAAATARDSDVVAIGIDAEPDLPLPEEVLEIVATPGELGLLGAMARAGDGEGPCWDRLLFSAKEAVFKAWCPRVTSWLAPQETEIVFRADDGTFTALLSPEGAGAPRTRLVGRWAQGNGLLLTAVVLPRPGAGCRR